MKRLLCITLSAILLASFVCQSAFAAPVSMGSIETVEEYIPSVEAETGIFSDEPRGVPTSLTSLETVEETNTYFPVPENVGDASLYSSFEGEGTEESPYLISNKDELLAFSAAINSATDVDAHYKLTSDIDLEGEEWTPVGYYSKQTEYSTAFQGVFDGDGHTVSNITITDGSNIYIGFFGLIYNGTVKNLTLDNLNINVNSTISENSYIGGIVGRSIAKGQNNISEFYNCNVTNSSITAVNLGSLYVGGIAGIALSGRASGAETRFIFSNFDGSISVTAKATTAKKGNGDIEYHTATAGGILGYYGAESYSIIKLKYCNASGDISVDSSTTGLVAPHAGGLAGELVTYDGYTINGGTAEVEGCFSEGTAIVRGVITSLGGGMFGYLCLTKGFSATNCYTTVDVSGSSRSITLCAGGFVGLLEFEGYSSSFPKTISNCYATGDAIDLAYSESSLPESSYVGAIAGYTYAGIFTNCYKFDYQVLIGTDKPLDNATLLTDEQAKDKNSYPGFDFDKVWEISSTAEYRYPTLTKMSGYALFLNEGSYYEESFFAEDGVVTPPAVNPSKTSTVDKFYTFAYWSTEKNGDPFYFKTQTLSDDAVFHAVYTESVRAYTITFYTHGGILGTPIEAYYGSSISVPEEIPVKPETEQFRYEFLYWSNTENGEEFDFSDYTVKGYDMFFAVFEEIDKTAWEGGVASEFARGVGSEALPYVITTSDEFALFAKVIASGDEHYSTAYYELGADINIGGRAWYPIGSPSFPFSGHFDGKGHMIKKFVITPASDYAGLFGYVSNGTIKNVHLFDFEVNYSRNASGRNVYVGAVAAYVCAKLGTSEISGIKVTANSFNASAESNRVFAGNIIGFGTSRTDGVVIIKNCFATSDINITNTYGQCYVGGIAGELDTESAGNSLIRNCYNTGSVVSKAKLSSYAGGIAGYLYSTGSSYMPIPKPNAELSDDTDLMLDGCFAISNVTSESESSDSVVGRIISGYNEQVAYSRIVYPGNINVSISQDADYICNIGESVLAAVLQDDEWLAEELGFDFENVWTITPDSKYPVLSAIVLDKFGVHVLTLDYDGKGNLSSTVKVIENEHDFTVVFSVYNSNNQLIKVVRNSFDSSVEIATCEYSFENLSDACTVTVCALDKFTLAPLYNACTYEL